MRTEARFLLDTNVFVYVLEGLSEPAARRIEQSEVGSLVTSAVCLAELVIGLAPEHQRSLRALLDQIEVKPFDEAAARAYGSLPFRRGRFDRLIAAHAMSLGLTIITSNLRDFADVPQLAAEDWTLP